MHFYDARYPTAPTALITPPDASVADYRKLQARLGLERNVVVQPTTYGTDNRCTLEAIAALGAGARGVATVDQTVTDAELDRLTKAGIRGVRFHMLPGGALPWDMLETMAARVGAFGWHVQFQLDGTRISRSARRGSRSCPARWWSIISASFSRSCRQSTSASARWRGWSRTAGPM